MAIGLLIADLVVFLIGIGPVHIGVVVALAMAAAVFFWERSLFVNQGAISAILVIFLQPPDSGFSRDRFFNALVGEVVALVVNHLFPINSEHLVKRTARPIFDELAAMLEEVAPRSKGATSRGPGARCSGPGRSTSG